MKSDLYSQIENLELSSAATQKTIRETVQALLSALKTLGATACLAMATMFGAMDVDGAVTGTTKWEEVSPTTEMNELVALANDEDLTVVKYLDGSILVTNIVGTISYAAFNTILRNSKIVKIGRRITSIGALTFDRCSGLTSVSIPDSVTSIGSSAFHICIGLSRVTIPASVTSIGAEAFQGSSLSSITFLGKTISEVKAMSNYPWAIPANCKIYAMDDGSHTGGTYPLFVIDLNPDDTRTWNGVELKATINNFSSDQGMKFFGASAANGMNVPGLSFTYDWFRLYVLSRRADSDVRKWTRITNTTDLGGYAPLSLAIIVDPELFKRNQGSDWLSENNEEIIWSYTRIGLVDSEKDQDGVICWRPIMPVKWYKTLPSWANQVAVTPNGSDVTPYVPSAPGSLSNLPPFDFSTMKGMYFAVSNVVDALGGSVTNFPAISSEK